MNKGSKCPYCKRKISYFRRFIEHNMGEHECKHCNKKSNIKQQGLIWALFAICVFFAFAIMLFYLSFSDSIMRENAINGSHATMMKLFFGKFKVVKWFLWEMIPFVLFYFLAPLFIIFTPQQRYMEQTTTSIDLNIPKVPLNNTAGKKEPVVTTNTRVIPKNSEGSFEDIRSSSDNLEKTRAFDVNDLSNNEESDTSLRSEGISVRRAAFESDKTEEKVNITKPSTSVSNSYRDDSPLRKIPIEERVETKITEKAPEDIKEYVPSKTTAPTVIRTAKETEKPKGNYSANRKF